MEFSIFYFLLGPSDNSELSIILTYGKYDCSRSLWNNAKLCHLHLQHTHKPTSTGFTFIQATILFDN